MNASPCVVWLRKAPLPSTKCDRLIALLSSVCALGCGGSALYCTWFVERGCSPTTLLRPAPTPVPAQLEVRGLEVDRLLHALVRRHVLALQHLLSDHLKITQESSSLLLTPCSLAAHLNFRITRPAPFFPALASTSSRASFFLSAWFSSSSACSSLRAFTRF